MYRGDLSFEISLAGLLLVETVACPSVPHRDGGRQRLTARRVCIVKEKFVEERDFEG